MGGKYDEAIERPRSKASRSEYSKKYKEIQLVGRGQQGSASLIENKTDGKRYVSKKILLSGLGDKGVAQVVSEMRLLKEMKHPNVVRFIEGYKEKSRVIIVMEYCERGDLSQHIKETAAKGDRLDERVILQWFVQICQALHFIHSKHVVHRDIKSSNIFLTTNNTVKIGDFGISKQLSGTLDQAHTLIGTPNYLSPEVCQNKAYSFKSDLWSLGCVLYELCALQVILNGRGGGGGGGVPYIMLPLGWLPHFPSSVRKGQNIFPSIDQLPFQSKSLMNLVVQIVQDNHQQVPDCYSDIVHHFIRLLLQKKPENRPTARDILTDQRTQDLMKEFVSDNEKGKQVGSDVIVACTTRSVEKTEPGKITLMEQEIQARLKSQQTTIREKIQELNQQPQQSMLRTPREQSFIDASQEADIQRKERELQERIEAIQSQVKQSYHELERETFKESAEHQQDRLAETLGATVTSQLFATEKKKKKQQQTKTEQLSNSSTKEMAISLGSSRLSEDTNSDNLQEEEDNERLQQSSVIHSESEASETKSELLETSSEGEREEMNNMEENEQQEIEGDEDEGSEGKLSPSMDTQTVQLTQSMLKMINKQSSKDSQQSHVREKADFLDETSMNLSMNLSLTTDSLFPGFGGEALKGITTSTNKALDQNKIQRKISKRLSSLDKRSDQGSVKEEDYFDDFEDESDKQKDQDSDGDINKLQLQKKISSYKIDDMNQEEEEEEEEQNYADDFEEYKEDNEQYLNNDSEYHFNFESDEDESYNKADFDELDSILQIYKTQLSHPFSILQSIDHTDKQVFLTAIAEEESEASTLFSQSRSQVVFDF